jgi:hypothetical protein
VISSYLLFSTRLHSSAIHIVIKNIIRTAEQKFIRINHDKLFQLEVVWLDRNDRRISTSKMRTIDDNDNDEIHLKNDPFNIQVYTFIVG